MEKTKKAMCNRCNEMFNYTASEIIFREILSGRKDIADFEIKDTEQVVQCPKCGLKMVVYNKLDIAGNFLD